MEELGLSRHSGRADCLQLRENQRGSGGRLSEEPGSDHQGSRAPEAGLAFLFIEKRGAGGIRSFSYCPIKYRTPGGSRSLRRKRFLPPHLNQPPLEELPALSSRGSGAVKSTSPSSMSRERRSIWKLSSSGTAQKPPVRGSCGGSRTPAARFSHPDRGQRSTGSFWPHGLFEIFGRLLSEIAGLGTGEAAMA